MKTAQSAAPKAHEPVGSLAAAGALVSGSYNHGGAVVDAVYAAAPTVTITPAHEE